MYSKRIGFVRERSRGSFLMTSSMSFSGTVDLLPLLGPPAVTTLSISQHALSLPAILSAFLSISFSQHLPACLSQPLVLSASLSMPIVLSAFLSISFSQHLSSCLSQPLVLSASLSVPLVHSAFLSISQPAFSQHQLSVINYHINCLSKTVCYLPALAAADGQTNKASGTP